jgi:hypothetical protein
MTIADEKPVPQEVPIVPHLITGVLDVSTIKTLERLKLIILGEPGSGKSWLVCTGRKPILEYDFDDRSESIAGKPGVYVKTLIDRNQEQPMAWSTLEQDIGALEYAKQKNELRIRTLALDSLTNMIKAAHNQLMKDNEKLRRKIVVNGKNYLVTQEFDAITTTQKMIEGVLNRLYELGVDVICTAHIRREKAAEYTVKNPVFTDKYTIDPQNMKYLLPGFNERWFMKDRFEVLIHPDYEFNAVSALRIKEDSLPADENFIEKVLARHQASL